MTGSVSNIVAAKKYGFITGENGREYFFHMSDTVGDWDNLVEDFIQLGGGKIKVSFEPVKTPKGPRANAVTVIAEI